MTTLDWNDTPALTAPTPGHYSQVTPTQLTLIAASYMAAPRALRVNLGADPLPLLTANAQSATYYGVSTSGTCLQVRAYPLSGSCLSLSLNALSAEVSANLNGTHTAALRGEYLGTVFDLRLTYAP